MNSTDQYLCRNVTSLGGSDRQYLADTQGGNTGVGVLVNHRTALKYNPVWSAIQTISGDIAKIPLNQYLRTPEAGPKARTRAIGTTTQQLVRWQANPRMSAFRFWRRMMVHLLLWNRAYAVIERDSNYRPVALWPLLPDRTTYYDQGQDEPVYLTEIGGKLHPFADADVLDLQGICVDDMYREACDLVVNARNDFALGLAAQNFGSKFFANGANTGGILTIPPGFSEQAADNLAEGVRKKHTSIDNSFKTMVLRDGAKFHSTQVDPEKSQLLETRRESVADVARWYSLPPHKLGLDNSSSYSSLEQENRSYLQTTLLPWLVSISSQCYMKLLTGAEQIDGDNYFEHNTNAFLATDTLTQYQVSEIGIRSGILSPNEARAAQNINPREDGLGDRYFFSNNMQPVTPTTFAPQPPTDTELLRSTTDIFNSAVQRCEQKTVNALKRLARKKPDSPFLSESRSVFTADLAPFAKPLSLLLKKEESELVKERADQLFANVNTTMTTATALQQIETNLEAPSV